MAPVRAWLASWKVFAAAMISLEAALISAFDAYSDGIEELA